jgi:hypothetical protein
MILDPDAERLRRRRLREVALRRLRRRWLFAVAERERLFARFSELWDELDRLDAEAAADGEGPVIFRGRP